MHGSQTQKVALVNRSKRIQHVTITRFGVPVFQATQLLRMTAVSAYGADHREGTFLPSKLKRTGTQLLLVAG